MKIKIYRTLTTAIAELEAVNDGLAAAVIDKLGDMMDTAWVGMTEEEREQVNTTTATALIGGPGWKKGVLDCIDTLAVREANGQVSYGDAVERLTKLYERDTK